MSTPPSSNHSTSSTVIPKPLYGVGAVTAQFSALATTRSRSCSRRSPGRRPARYSTASGPTMSPTISTFMDPALRRQVLPGVGQEVSGGFAVEGVEAPLSPPFLAHEARLFELAHVVGDPGLAHLEALLEL